MTAIDTNPQIFWLASRALGIVAIVLLSVSVSLGLATSGRLLRRHGGVLVLDDGRLVLAGALAATSTRAAA